MTQTNQKRMHDSPWNVGVLELFYKLIRLAKMNYFVNNRKASMANTCTWIWINHLSRMKHKLKSKFFFFNFKKVRNTDSYCNIKVFYVSATLIATEAASTTFDHYSSSQYTAQPQFKTLIITRKSTNLDQPRKCIHLKLFYEIWAIS